MLEFKIWLNNFLAENGATTANEKTIAFMLILICIILFFNLAYMWLFKWHPLKRKVDKYLQLRKKQKLQLPKYGADGLIINAYFFENKTG